MPDFVVDYQNLLYVKMQHEYALFLDDLKALTIEEAIEHSYEKVIKQEFICLCEEIDLLQNEAEALYKMDNTLDGLYQAWLKSDGGIHSVLESVYTDTAKRELNYYVSTLEQQTHPSQSPQILPSEIPDISGMVQAM